MSSQQAIVQFAYPQAAASTFKLDYYINSHMPLIEKYWGPRGLLSWTVTKGEEGADYFVQVTTFWESLEEFEKVKAAEEVMGDVKNFSDVKPFAKVGLIVGQGKTSK